MKAIQCSVYDFEKEIHKYKSFTYVRDNVWEPMNIRTEFNIAAVGFTIRPYLIFKSDTTVMHISSIKKVMKFFEKDHIRYRFYCDTEVKVDKFTSNYFDIICL